MGLRNSSKTRVVPVFDFLFKTDETGRSWLPRLLRLPVGSNRLSLPPDTDFCIQEARWGRNEKKLDPPVALLSWLIRHPRMPLSGQLSSNPIKAQKRRELIEGSEARLEEGLCLLHNNPNGEDWHIFEGQTQPDVFIQTPSVIVVAEGKRTEREPTRATKWMAGRHQMLRHIDCAWEARGTRQVIGFFIVQGVGDGGEVPVDWLNYTGETVCADVLNTSLPHRGPQEQKEIASCFIGATTWETICGEFNLPSNLLLETTSKLGQTI